MESVKRSCYDGAIAECLGSECSANRRIEALEKTLGGRHEDAIQGRRGRDLGKLDDVWLDAIDGGGAVDVVLAEPCARGKDLAVSQVGESGGRVGFGCAISMAREDV